MNVTNYVSVDEVVKAVEDVGFKWIASRNISSHPDDWYLKVVMAYRESTSEWVVWLYNASLKGLHEGYYTFDVESARNKYMNK